MRAASFEFRQRLRVIGFIFRLWFSLYFAERQNVIAPPARSVAGDGLGEGANPNPILWRAGCEGRRAKAAAPQVDA